MHIEGWRTVEKIKIPAKDKKLVEIDDLALSPKTKDYLRRLYQSKLYIHQKEAVKAFLNKENVCMTTGTSSGKSLPFYIGGMEVLAKDPKAKIIAIYPMKALGREQEDRWKAAMEKAGFPVSVGRIDGNVGVNKRKSILEECQIVIMTPDVIHAWLLYNVSDRAIVRFLKSVAFIVIDEVHSYSGVFGSNSAFLFRRLRHLLQLCGQYPQFMCASATIAQPAEHLKKLTGVDFVVIGPEIDGSPKYDVEIIMLDPPKNADFMTEMAVFFGEIAKFDERFIAFVDSRKQAELLSAILNRKKKKSDEEAESTLTAEHLLSADILPFRAGYEVQDRETIQRRLSDGTLKGVISTSALELGIDIPNLDIAVLVGVPTSLTSLYQRIGRIGRHREGKVFVINNGSTFNEMIFDHPQTLLERPMKESSLYLENPRMQYIHALCLARLGGEHDQLCQMIGKADEEKFQSAVEFPEGFIRLCQKERIGEIPVDLREMKAEAGEDPNHTFPLRDVESQFKVELKQGPVQRDLGSLSYAQVLREAYPGAVYYYTTQAYRVYKVNQHTKVITVRQERQYTTSPQSLPILVFPNISEDNVYRSVTYGDLLVFECNIQVRESVSGFKEQRGPTTLRRTYPLTDPVTYDVHRFTRNYFTSGVILLHPVFNNENVEVDKLAEILCDSFLIKIPFDRQDVEWAIDKVRTDKPPYIKESSKFIAIFDKTYGSLRLSGHLMKDDTLGDVLEQAIKLAKIKEKEGKITGATTGALLELSRLSANGARPISLGGEEIGDLGDMLHKIILPNSKGLVTYESNREFLIERVFFSPRTSELMYGGRYLDQKTAEGNLTISIPASKILEIPGESQTGFYNLETGEILETLPEKSLS